MSVSSPQLPPAGPSFAVHFLVVIGAAIVAGVTKLAQLLRRNG